MAIDPMKRISAEHILRKHGLTEMIEKPPEKPRFTPEEREKARRVMLAIQRKYRRPFRSMIDPQHRTSWPVPDPKDSA